MRRCLIAANWKMNKTFIEGLVLANAIIVQDKIWKHSRVDVLLCPSFLQLHTIGSMIKETAQTYIGAQNCHWAEQGAYTGEISANMLKNIDCSYVILGHSERREYFKETAKELLLKVEQVLKQGLKIIFCIGESLEQRQAGQAETHIQSQLAGLLDLVQTQDRGQIILAYEPIWAIGTGQTATSEQAQSMHAFIRQTLAQAWGEEQAQKTQILYGGSCNANNAQELLSQNDVDGALIGGASLKEEEFMKIIKQAVSLN